MKWKRLVAEILAVCCLTGCMAASEEQVVNSGSEPSAPSVSTSGETTRLTFRYHVSRDAPDHSSVEIYKAVDAFNESNPYNIFVETLWLSDLEAEMQPSVETDLYWDYDLSRKNVAEGEYLDLAPYLNQDSDWKQSFRGGILNQMTVEDGVYGIPLSINYSYLYYDIELFEQAGVNAADIETWQDFLDACRSLKAAEIEPLSSSLDFYYEPELYAAYAVYRFGGREAVEAIGNLDKNATFFQPCFERACALAAQLYEENYVQVNDSLYQSGPAAIFRHHTMYQLSERFDNEAPREDFGVLPFPQVQEPLGTSKQWIGVAENIAVSSKTEHPELAVEFLKYMTSDPVQRALLEEAWQVPAVQAVDYDVEKVPRHIREVIEYTAQEGVETFPPLEWRWGLDIYNVFYSPLDSVVRGEQTPQEAMRSAQEDYQAIRESA